MRAKLLSLILFIIICFTSCDFVNKSFGYPDIVDKFINLIIHEEYEGALEYFSIDIKSTDQKTISSLKDGLVGLSQAINNNWKKDLNFALVKATQSIPTNSMDKDLTQAIIEFSDDENLGNLNIVFDNENSKIVNIQLANIKKPIPNMILFWIIGIIAISVPIFNIAVIVYVKKNSKKRNWHKYLSIALLNFPSIIYSAVYGFSINVLSIQILFGISFSALGYSGSIWIIGLPIGGIFWLIKTKIEKDRIKKNSIDSKEDTEHRTTASSI